MNKSGSWELGVEEAEALVNVLQERVDHLVEESNKSISNEFYDINNVKVLGLCRIVEEILQHGMKQPETGVVFWAFQLHTSLPGTTETLDRVRNATDSPIGRGRVFIRLALNQSALVDYLRALVWNTKLTNTYYTDSACLRSKQDEVCAALDSLQKLRFRLPLYSSELDRSDYWTLQAKRMIDASGGTEDFVFALSGVSEAERIRRARQRKEKDRRMTEEAENKKKADEEERRRAILEQEKRQIEQELQALMELQKREQEEALKRKLREQKEEEERLAKKRFEEEQERKRKEEQELILKEALRLEQEMAQSRQRREEEKKRKERNALEEDERKTMAAEDAFCRELRIFWKAKDLLDREQKRLQKEREEAEKRMQEEVERKLQQQLEEVEKERKQREEAMRRRENEMEEVERGRLQEQEQTRLRLEEAERSLRQMELKRQQLLASSPDSPDEAEVVSGVGSRVAEGTDEGSDSGKEALDELEQVLDLVEDHFEALDSLVASTPSPKVTPPGSPGPLAAAPPQEKPLNAVSAMRQRDQRKQQQKRVERGRGGGGVRKGGRGGAKGGGVRSANTSPVKGPVVFGSDLQPKNMFSIRTAYYGRLLTQGNPPAANMLPIHLVDSSVESIVRRSKSLSETGFLTENGHNDHNNHNHNNGHSEKEQEKAKGGEDLYRDTNQIPTERPPWVDDKEVFACTACSANFSYLVRKHHCRLCGLIYCGKCCCQKKDLPPELNYTRAERVCVRCVDKFFTPSSATSEGAAVRLNTT